MSFKGELHHTSSAAPSRMAYLGTQNTHSTHTVGHRHKATPNLFTSILDKQNSMLHPKDYLGCNLKVITPVLT